MIKFQKLYVGLGLTLLVVLLVSLLWSRGPDQSSSTQSRELVSDQPKRSPVTILDRVRSVAQARLPAYSFRSNEAVVLSQIGAGVTELETMNLLLAIEREFEIDISKQELVEELGSPLEFKELREHLSLARLAVLVEKELLVRGGSN